MMQQGFHRHIFTAHIYPLADILRHAKAVYLRDYTVAVRIESSMTRHNRKIYEPSPTETWIEMFETIYSGLEFEYIRKDVVDFICSTNSVGLVQLRNYGDTSIVAREIRTLLRRRKANLLSPSFIAFSLLSLLTPSAILSRLSDAYKRRILGPNVDVPVKTFDRLP